MSKRQERKAARAGSLDKYGFSKSQSRRVRRALRRQMFSQCYIGERGPFRIAVGSSQIKDNKGAGDHLLYGGGSFHAH